MSNIRADGIRTTDVTLEKIYQIGEQYGHLEVHADCFNCTDRFGLPDTGVGDTSFGIINFSAAGALPRNMQLGARYEF